MQVLQLLVCLLQTYGELYRDIFVMIVMCLDEWIKLGDRSPALCYIDEAIGVPLHPAGQDTDEG